LIWSDQSLYMKNAIIDPSITMDGSSLNLFVRDPR
jgi:hypothetical protein